MPPLSSHMCTTWPLNTDAACWDIPAGTPQATIDFWHRAASEYLWAATGRRLGPSCPVTVRPCRKSCAEGYGQYFNQGQFLGSGFQFTGGMIPYMAGGRMYNATLCGCTADCHCGPELCQIELPGPVYDIVDVQLDGFTVDSATYALYDARFLTRINDPQDEIEEPHCWPTCQDLTLTPAHPGTFSVTFRTGLSLNNMATAAVTELTAHFIRGCNGCGCGTGTQRNLSRLSRQGVELEFVDPQSLFDNGLTGIPVVDWFIRVQNPDGLTKQSRVLSPDAPKRPRIYGGNV